MNSTILRGTALAVLSAACISGADATVDYQQIFDDQNAYIAQQQLPSGAFRVHHTSGVSGYGINPYFANLACMSLLEDAATYGPQVKDYLQWYLGKLNWPDYQGLYGTVYDYTANTSTLVETSTGGYDSVDSYAATFISLVRRYHDVTGDTTFVTTNSYKLSVISGLMVQMVQTPDGLTIAKPDYPVKYLMDNAEVARGLKDAGYLFTSVIGNTTAGSYYTSWSNTVKSSIDSRLWGVSSTLNGWFASRQGTTNGTFSWTTFYADSVAQLFPIVTESHSPSDTKAVTAYSSFCTSWPNWHNGTFGSSSPWAVMGYAAALMGDSTKADAYLAWAETNYMSAGNPWTWTIADSSWAALTANIYR